MHDSYDMEFGPPTWGWIYYPCGSDLAEVFSDARWITNAPPTFGGAPHAVPSRMREDAVLIGTQEQRDEGGYGLGGITVYRTAMGGLLMFILVLDDSAHLCEAP